MLTLTERMQALERLAHRPGREADFTRAYLPLVRELSDAVTAVQSLGAEQARWCAAREHSERPLSWDELTQALAEALHQDFCT